MGRYGEVWGDGAWLRPGRRRPGRRGGRVELEAAQREGRLALAELGLGLGLGLGLERGLGFERGAGSGSGLGLG
jgi:hypothetical protein